MEESYFIKSNSALLGCFSRFLKCKNDTKSLNALHTWWVSFFERNNSAYPTELN